MLAVPTEFCVYSAVGSSRRCTIKHMRLKLSYFVVIEIGLCLLLWGLVLDYPKFIADPDNNGLEMAIVYIGLAAAIVGFGVAIIRVLQGKVPQPIGGEGVLTELSVMHLLRNRPSFIFPALLTTALPLVILGGLFLVPKIAVQPFKLLIDPAFAYHPLAGILTFFFLVVFVIVMLQIWGMLVAGELLQRHFKLEAHNMLVHMVKNTIFALPFALVYTVVFVFVALLRKKESKTNMAEALKVTGIVATLQTLKYYIYANLSMLAFEDKYTYATLRDSAQYLRANAGRLLTVFANTAVLSGGVILYLFVLVVWADKLPFFTPDTIFPLVFAVGALVIAWMAFVEQILFLLNFIQVRHPQYNVYALLSDAQHAVVVANTNIISTERR